MDLQESFALLAPLSSDGTRPQRLVSDDGRFGAAAQALTDGARMQMLGVTVLHDGVWTRLVFDYMGRLAALASADAEDEANAHAHGDLRRKGMAAVSQQPLLAGAVSGPRRTSVLQWGDGLSLRVKRMDDSEGGTWLQIRAYMDTSAGYVHAVLTDVGQVACVVSGRTDQDAWTRVQGELTRQGIESI